MPGAPLMLTGHAGRDTSGANRCRQQSYGRRFLPAKGYSQTGIETGGKAIIVVLASRNDE